MTITAVYIMPVACVAIAALAFGYHELLAAHRRNGGME